MTFERHLAVLVPALAGAAFLLLASTALADGPTTDLQQEALARVQADTGGRGVVGFSRQSGALGMLRFEGAEPPVVSAGARQDEVADALAFAYADLFGAASPRDELELVAIGTDSYGSTRYQYRQVHVGVPVFGGHLRVHFGASGAPFAINGMLLPDIGVDPVPRLDAAGAARIAIDTILAELPSDPAAALMAESAPELFVYRLGLTQGRSDGATHLVWEVVVAGASLRELVYVDAHTGRVVDRTTGILQALERRVLDDATDDVLREEGDRPTGSPEVDRIYDVSGDTYDLFANAFGFLSWDGEDSVMTARAFWDDPICPNAVWTGSVTRFCEGAASEDVVGHEWTHAYIQSTADLVYQYQSGALNEAYADIFGEVVDLINDDCRPPQFTCESTALRRPSLCPEQTSPAPVLTVDTPATLAGRYVTGPALFGPPWIEAGPIEGAVVAAEDGEGVGTDACQPIVNGAALSGNIALVERGACLFFEKVQNAESAGAIAVIVANNEGNDAPSMFYDGDLTVSIPAISVGRELGARIRDHLPGVSVTIEQELSVGDTGMRWLLGEPTGSLGVLRDLWNPACFADPGRVGDERYGCTDGDSGGVHTNSLVASHAFALLVDGGLYNGRTIPRLGLIKASHIYWLALSAYSGRTTTFAQHADDLEAACAELRDGEVPLTDPLRGRPTAAITRADCDALAEAILAVELRELPRCALLLEPNPPPICAAGGLRTVIFREDFETSPAERWSFTNAGVGPDYRARDWQWVGELPLGREGQAAFADGSAIGNCDNDDQSGVVELTSPSIELPEDAGPFRLTFEHSVATEPVWDGGNLRVSINGGPFELIGSADFLFNAYNREITSESGSPLAGEPAFSGGGESGFASPWGQSQVDLSRLAVPGDALRVRFRFGMDCGVGFDGWYVDDVAVVHCPVCAIDADCADGDPCTTDVCDAELGTCSNPPAESGTLCGDQTAGACDAADTCDGLGACVANHASAGAPCGDPTSDECTAPDSCDGDGVCQPNHAPDASACTPADACTESACSEGLCRDTGAVDCDDGDPCTDDRCEPADGCHYEPSDDPVCGLDPDPDPDPDPEPDPEPDPDPDPDPDPEPDPEPDPVPDPDPDPEPDPVPDPDPEPEPEPDPDPAPDPDPVPDPDAGPGPEPVPAGTVEVVPPGNPGRGGSPTGGCTVAAGDLGAGEGGLGLSLLVGLGLLTARRRTPRR